MNQLINILKIEGRQIVDEFSLASAQGQGTPQEVADFRENAVQSFVARFYPQSQIVSKGKITDFEGRQSDSIDCLILNPAHPNLIDSKGKFRLIFSDGCDAAIEVKPNLARTDELYRALDQGVSVKKVKRSQSAILLASRTPAHIIEHSLYVPFFIFSVNSFLPRKLHAEIAEYYIKNQTLVEDQIDGVCVNGLGILRNIKHKEQNPFAAEFPIGSNTGWYFEKWGEITLVGFLLSLGNTYASYPSVAEPIMSRVLTRLGSTYVERLGDCV